MFISILGSFSLLPPFPLLTRWCGVPLSNYVGWLIISTTLMLAWHAWLAHTSPLYRQGCFDFRFFLGCLRLRLSTLLFLTHSLPLPLSPVTSCSLCFYIGRNW